MEFRLLGTLDVRSGPDVVPIRAARQRSVLTGLLLSANEVVTVDRLVDLVWGEAAPRSAEANLRNHVTALRRRLSMAENAERVLARSGGYLVVVRPGELDLTMFDELTRQGVQAQNDGWHALAARLFGRALALWRGELLENVTVHGAEPVLARLREARVGTLEKYLQARVAAGEHAEVISELRGHIVEYPLREQLWALLMLALAGSGQQAAALQSYATIRQRLADELGVEPGAALRSAHQRVLRQDIPGTRIEQVITRESIGPSGAVPSWAGGSGRTA
jgi:DNA-binding SARP family transcriptional activator